MWESVLAGSVGSLAGGLLGGDAAEDAANAQANAVANASAMQQRQFETTRRDFAPQRALGHSATGRLARELGLGLDLKGIDAPVPKGAVDLTSWAAQRGYDLPRGREWDDTERQNLYAAGYQQYLDQFRAANPEPAAAPGETGFLTRRFTMEDMNADPVMKASFDFGLSEGEKAVQRMFGAKGMSRSGAAVKAATRFASDYTNQKGGDAYNRFTTDQNNLYSRLSGAAGIGTQAQQTVAQAGANTAANVGSMIVGEGNARGAAAIARGNAMGGALSSIGNNVMGQYNLDRILTNGGINPRPAFSFNAAYGGNDFAVG